MRDSKVSHKREKSSRWTDVVKGYTFFFAGILCQIFALLLLSVWKEFSDMTSSRYESLADLAAIVLVILLLIVWSMRWTYPMSVEEPLIIILIWIILSSRISSTHCFCCRGPEKPLFVGPHHHAAEVHADAVAAAAVVDSDEDAPHHAKHHHKKGDGDDMMLEIWQLLVEDCHLESFNFLYSLLCVVLVFVAFCTELRNYYISLMFRLTTAGLVAILLILLVVSPSLCSKFDISDSVVTLARITLFLAIGWINKYRRATERSVAHDYSEVVTVTTETLTMTNVELPAHLATHKSGTPRELFLHFAKLARFLARLYTEEAQRDKHAKKRRRKKNSGGRRDESDESDLPLGRVDIEDDDEEDEDEEDDFDRRKGGGGGKRHNKEQNRLQAATGDRLEEAEVENVEETMTDIMIHLFNLSNKYKKNYLSGAVCWKNRAHSKHLLHLIDLAHVVWLLIVCPQWLLLAPLEIIWLLYYIRLNTVELRETRKFVALQSAVLAKSTELLIAIY